MKRLILITALMVVIVFISRAKAEIVKVPLINLTPKKVITLKGSYSHYTLKVPIAKRWHVNKAFLKLKYVNSSLLSKRSAIIIKINGYVIGQIKLSSLSSEGELNILIPGTAFFAGDNDLSFFVIQHYQTKKRCEDSSAPELWTTLYIGKSYIEIEYTSKDIPLRLSSVCNFLFDPRIFPQGKVNFVLEKIDPKYLKLAGIVASGISLRFNHRNVTFTVSQKLREGEDNILIGNSKFVEDFLSKTGTKAKVEGAYLRIFHLPADEYIDKKHALLVVSGRNLKELECATKSIAVISFPFPDSDRMIVKELDIPKPLPYTGKLILRPGYKYTFKDLGFVTHTFKEIYPLPKDLIFSLPSDLLIKPNRYAALYLHFAYGAGMRSDSVLNILLNGKYITAIHFDNPDGMVYENYKITIPTYLFRRGINKITFMPVLTPSMTGICKFIQTKNLFLTLFSDSSFYFPSLPHRVDMPRIELLFEDGFPLTRFPDASRSMFYITSQDNRTLNSFLNLIGLLTKKIGYPLLGLNVEFKNQENIDKELVIIGPINTIPAEFKESAPLKLLAENKVYYPIISLKGRPVKAEIKKLKQTIKKFFYKEKANKPSKIIALSSQISSLGDKKGLIMEFESPYKKGRTVIVFTARSSSALEKMSKVILNAGVQAGCSKDISLIELTPPYKVSSVKVGKAYYIGKFGKVDIPTYYFRKQFYLFFIFLFVTIAVLSVIVLVMLRRYRRKRGKNVEKYIED